MSEQHWRATVHPSAVDTLKTIRDTDPSAMEEIVEVIYRLSLLEDPRHPRSCVNVEPLRDAEGMWFRARCLRPGGNGDPYRVIFRLLQKRGSKIVVVGVRDWLTTGADDQAIEVMDAGKRATIYTGLWGKVRKIEGKAA